MNSIVLVGVPGTGKTTVLQEVLRLLPEVRVINFGDKMVDEAAISRDSLRRLPFQEQQEIGIIAARKIAEEKGLVIIDTHALVKTDSGYCPGMPRQVLEILAPKAYALVESKPELILQRRRKDQGRRREDETIEQLVEHQEMTRSFITSCCMYTGSMLCLVRNDSPDVNQNIAPLIQLMLRLCK